MKTGNSAYIARSRLKVMLEEDYEALRAETRSAKSRADNPSNEARDEDVELERGVRSPELIIHQMSEG